MEHGLIKNEEIQTLQLSKDKINFKDIDITRNFPSSSAEQTLEEKEALWDEGTTKLLLDKYERYLGDVGPVKKFKNKKQMWQQISKDLGYILNIEKTATQCKNRFKTVMKRKKKSVMKNKHTGESPEHVKYEDEIERISAIDDSVAPELCMGVNKAIIKKSSKETPGGSKIKKETKKHSVGRVLWEIHEKKEEERNKRHREKMELLREIGQKMCPPNN